MNSARPVIPEQPRQRLGAEQRRASILSGAATAFAQGGYTATSMADIANHTGVSHLIVYRHFASKEALYTEVLAGAAERLRVAFSNPASMDGFGPSATALLRVAREDEDAFRVLWRHAAREPDFTHHTEAARQQLLSVARNALATIVEPPHREWAARATVGYLIEAVLIWIEDGDPRLDARFTAATSAALKAGVRSWSR